MNRYLLGIAAAVMLCVVPLLTYAQDKKILRVSGAGMAADQVQVWSREFMETNPELNIVVSGSSAGKGFQSLFDKQTEIALASRDISPAEKAQATEKGLKLDNKLVGYAAVAVITTKSNPVTELSLAQLKGIFRNEITEWKEVGGPDLPIRTLTRRIPESGGAVFFWEKVLNRDAYGPKVIFAETWGAILKVCSTASDLPIGIAPAFVAKGDLRVIAVKSDDASPAVLPTDENLRARKYPIILPFTMYWDTRTQDEKLVKFVDFCASKGVGK